MSEHFDPDDGTRMARMDDETKVRLTKIAKAGSRACEIALPPQPVEGSFSGAVIEGPEVEVLGKEPGPPGFFEDSRLI